MKQIKMNSSLELMQNFPPKAWWYPIIWTCVIFFVMQLGVGALLTSLLNPVLGESTEMIATLYSFVAIIAGSFWVNSHINKRPLTTLGFHRKNWLKKYTVGIGLGLGLLIVIIGLSMILGNVSLQFNRDINWGLLLAMLFGFMVQGMAEEVLMRGYLQNSLATKKSFWFAMIGQAIVFTAIHGANPGITPMAVLNLFVVAILFGMLFCYTDSMWLVGGMHFTWNFVLGPVIGIEVSGNKLPTSVFQATVTGSDLLTGGSFGIEASILTTIIAVMGSIVIYRKLKR